MNESIASENSVENLNFWVVENREMVNKKNEWAVQEGGEYDEKHIHKDINLIVKYMWAHEKKEEENGKLYRGTDYMG